MVLSICRTMEHLANTARKISTRSGGHFAVIGVSETGAASFFCTHEDGELASLWQKEDLQRWLQQRHQQPDEAEARPGDQPAHTILGLGKLKKFLASLGVTTVRDLAFADANTVAAIHCKAQSKVKIQAALNHARKLVGVPPNDLVESGSSGGEQAAQGLAVERSVPVGGIRSSSFLQPLRAAAGQPQGADSNCCFE